MRVHIFVNDMLLMISAVDTALSGFVLFLIFYKIVFGLLLCLRTCLKMPAIGIWNGTLYSVSFLCEFIVWFFIMPDVPTVDIVHYISVCCLMYSDEERLSDKSSTVLGFCVCYVVPRIFSYHYMNVLHAGVFVIVIVSKTW